MAHRPKKHAHEEEMGEAWLLPYSDLMTLLLAVFIVLFAVSVQDTQKAAELSQAFSNEFGLFTPESPTVGIDSNSPVPTIVQNPNPSQERIQQQQQNMVENLKDEFQTYVLENELQEQIQISEKDDGLLITLTGDIWFNPGSATIDEEHAIIAGEVAAMISEKAKENPSLPFNVVITGHTDNMPIHNSQFSSNWSLSVMRAANFLEALLGRSDIDPSICSARGLGEMEPIATNSTAEGRQQNRRVEVFISFID